MADETTNISACMEMLLDLSKDVDSIKATVESYNSTQGSSMDNSFMPFMMGQNSGNNGYNSMWNNPFMYLIWLAMFGNGNGFGWGNNSAMNAETTNMLLQAVNTGNNTSQRDIDRLASNMNVSSSDLRNGLSNINMSLAQVANQIGSSVPTVINAVQNGDASIIQALQNSCCENRLAICQQTNALSNAISQLGFGISQDNALTRALLTQQNYEAQIRHLQEKNNELMTTAQTSVLLNRDDNNATAVTASIATAMTNLTAQLTAIQNAIAKIPTSAS